jgi:hypothetical protein
LRSKHLLLVAAFLLVLPVLLQSSVPMAYACNGNFQNLVSINSVTISPDAQSMIITVSLTTNQDRHGDGPQQVMFWISVSYGDNPLDPYHPGTWLYMSKQTVDLTDQGNGQLYAQATFVAPFIGTHYYLVIVNGFNADNGAWLGFAWVDPREGTTP